MKLLIVVLVVLCLSEARRFRPRPGRQRPARQEKKEQEDPGTILRCMAENYKSGEEQIKACRDCFKEVGDPFSEEGLPKARECATSYLPLEVQACSALVEQLTPGDEDKAEELIECFDETLKNQNYERCLSETNSVDTSEKLTDGAMCVLESWKYSMEYVKNNTKKAGGRFRGRAGGSGGRGGGKKKMMMKMLSIAHCQNANSDDQTKQEECKTCFSSAARSGFRRPRSRSDAGAKELVKAAMLNCSQQYLSPKYDNCTAAMADNNADKGQVFGCYIRVLVGDIVAECSTDISEANADTLDEVMDCGKETVGEFVKENASPKMMEKIAKMFGDKDDDDDDDE